MSVNLCVENICSLAADKLNRYKDMLDITYMQHVFICDDNTVRLLSNIELRQKVIEEIELLDKRIADSESHDKAEYLKIEQEIAAVQREIAKQDRINEAAARNKILEYSNAIKKNSNTRKSFAYVSATTYSNNNYMM